MQSFQIRTRAPPSPQAEIYSSELKFDLNNDYRRKGVTIDLDNALKLYNVFRNDCFDEDTRIRKCGETFRKVLEDYNNKMKDEIESHMKYAVDNALSGVRYEVSLKRVNERNNWFRIII